MKLVPITGENKIAIELPENVTPSVIPNKVKISRFVKERNYPELNKIEVTKKQGEKTCYFTDDIWDVSIYAPTLSYINKLNFDFKFLDENPELQLEAKAICYGWIFHKSGRKTTPAKIQTIWNRFSSFKKLFIFLSENNHQSLSALSNSTVWNNFKAYIKNLEYSESALVEMFVAINRVKDLESWLEIDFKLPSIFAKKVANKLAGKNANQTLSIPSKITNIIYGKAVKMVENCFKFRHEIAKTEVEIQSNFMAGKAIVDQKISSGIFKFISGPSDSQYAREVNNHQPELIEKIIHRNLSGFDYLTDLPNGDGWARFIGELTTACYICCAAFSGMRVDELQQMQPNAVTSHVIDNREFHFINSVENKIHNGKHLAWVCSPISKQAFEIITLLTDHMRAELQNSNYVYKNRTWLTQKRRSQPPKQISSWNSKLQTFARNAEALITEQDRLECLRSNPNSAGSIQKYVVVGNIWHLTTHQFRRTLSVFAASNKLSSALAIKQQLKHLYLQMSDWYQEGAANIKEKLFNDLGLTCEAELLTMLEQEKNKLTADKFFDFYNSDKTLSGTGGKAIMSMRENNTKLYSDWNTLYKAVKQKRLTLHSTLHSYCRNGYNCDMEGVINPAFCVNCNSDGSIIEEEHAIDWQRKHQKLTAYLNEHSDISFQEKLPLILQVQAAEVVMKDFKLPFTPFPELIEISIL